MYKSHMKNALYLVAPAIPSLGKHCFLPLIANVIKNNITSLKTHIIVYLSETVRRPQPGTRCQARVSSFFFKLITFKLVHSYNVKHLTCTIFCSSGLQNIYKLHIWKCSTFTIFTLLHLFTNNKKDIIYTK